MGLFSKRKPGALDDPDFGEIREGKTGSWEGTNFRLWGRSSVHVMIDGISEGPSPKQRSFVQSLRSDDEGIRSRIEESLERHAKDTSRKSGPFLLFGIYIPRNPPEQMWRLWYHLEGEEHYWYGAEIEGWHHIVPFTED